LLIIAAVSSAAQLSFAQERLAQGAAGRIDKTLYTTYNLGALVQVNWVVCGSTQNTAGCYGAGSLFPFGRIGALLEGEPQTDLTTNTVTSQTSDGGGANFMLGTRPAVLPPNLP
jgi:hypothetical protein